MISNTEVVVPTMFGYLVGVDIPVKYLAKLREVYTDCPPIFFDPITPKNFPQICFDHGFIVYHYKGMIRFYPVPGKRFPTDPTVLLRYAKTQLTMWNKLQKHHKT